jgi:alkaline phosphatase
MDRFFRFSSFRLRGLAVGLTAVFFLAAAAPGTPAQGAKNVIVMIADGAGFNTYDAASMYEGKWDPVQEKSTQVYDGPGWVKYACTTYPLNESNKPTGEGVQEPELIYRPERAWDTTPLAGKYPFAGYEFLMSAATDSAAAGTAIATGEKTFDASINWSSTGGAMRGRTLAELAKKQGKAVGVVTTVQWSHATPACLGGAHSVSRDRYEAIANEMLDAPYLDVIMGAGHPEFDDDGKPAAKPSAKPAQFVGGAPTWKLLKGGTHPKAWRLIQTKAQFEALASGRGYVGLKVLGVAQVHGTLQQKRGGYRPDDVPFRQPLLGSVPSLRTMVEGALSVLESDPDGLYLAIEGGAVDWANHTRQPARLIEEQIDFNQAVQAVVRWVETHSNWDETLLVVTADHETGMVWGKTSDKVAFAPLVDRGKGRVPELRHNSGEHTNSLVPLYVRGVGSQGFAQGSRNVDPTAQKRWSVQPAYVDNTDISFLARACLEAQPAPVLSTAPQSIAAPNSP